MSKTSHWNYVRSLCKRDFLKMGITRCEMCGTGMYLTFAHRRKRRFIQTDEELRHGVALLCQTDHQKLEHSSHEVMYDKITAIIRDRDEYRQIQIEDEHRQYEMDTFEALYG